jgi:broad specificity phosphatase PhoE
MPDKLYLVRHGETAWSKTGQHTGRTDLELTEQGKFDATRLGGRLKSLKVDRVFASPLKRARATCELSGFGPEAAIMDELLEWDYGAYEGKTSAQIRADRPDWDLFANGCPEGESVGDISSRADRALETFRKIEGTILVFSSGHLLRVLTARWLDCDAAFGRYLGLDPASLSLLGFEHGHLDPIIRFWNDARRA